MSEPKSRFNAFLDGMGRTLDLGATFTSTRIEKLRAKFLISPRQALASDSKSIIHDSRKALDRLVSEISAKAGESDPEGNSKISKILKSDSVCFLTLTSTETPSFSKKNSEESRSPDISGESRKGATVFIKCKAFIKSGTLLDTAVHPIIVNIKGVSAAGECSGDRKKTIVHKRYACER